MLQQKRSPEPLIAVVLGAIFIISLFPIFRISNFNYPSADDYAYGVRTFEAWRNTGSFAAVLQEAVNTSRHFYQTWQGTFSATFLMSLQPSIFGVHWYRLVPFILTGSLILSYLWFTFLLLVRILKTDISTWLIITLSLLFLTIQFPESIVEGFFWYNGSVYYGFFYALMLSLFSVLLSFELTRKSVAKWIYAAVAILLSLILGGGNFVTALIAPVILSLTAVSRYFILRKQVSPLVWISILCLLTSLTFSAVAPGNSYRQNLVSGLSPVNAILESFYFGAHYFLKWINIPLILIIGFLTPVIYKTASKTNFQFSYPGLFSLVTFGVFCALFTAPLYAMSQPGEGRLLNICRYSYYWLLLVNLFYYCGYIHKKGMFRQRIQQLNCLQERYATPARAGVLTFLIFSSAGFLFKSTSNRSASALLSGSASQYGKDMEARYERYLSDDPCIVVKSLSAKPQVLFFSDISPDRKHWQNEGVQRFFKKESVERGK